MQLTFYKLILIVFFVSFLSLQAQTNKKKIFQVEETTISAGAEYSIMLENAIRSGNAEQYIPKVLDENNNSVNAITPILGINFDTDADLSGYYHIPPDPHGAVGPLHLVAVNNTSIWWANKDGTSQVSKRLGKNASTAIGSFFETLSPVNGTFDPKVIYDQYNGRFVVITLERAQNSSAAIDPANTSRILVAVSATSDPNGTWYYHAINSKINVSGTEAWADYPGLAIGPDAIFITSNLFSYAGSYQGSRLWIIQKGNGSGGFYEGGSASVSIYDPATLASVDAVTMQPAHMFGVLPNNVVTYLVRYSGFNDKINEYLSIIEVNGTSLAPTFTNTWILLGDIDNLSTMNNAPQNGSTDSIETNDRRTLQAVWRNNFLYSTETIIPNSGVDANQATAHWTKMNASVAGGLALFDQGICGGEDIASGTYTFMSSIAVNVNDEMVLGFAASAPTIYPGAYYAGRIPTDPAGTTPYTGTLKAGEDYYYRTFGGSRNRWGDYSGMSVDPADDITFWIYNEYASTRGTVFSSYPTEDGRWATAFGKIVDPPLPVELTNFTVKEVNKKIILTWQTATEVNNYGFDVERKSSFVLQNESENSSNNWEAIGFVAGHGNSNSPNDYSYIDDSKPYGTVTYRLKQIDTDGTFEYSDEIEIKVTSTIENKLVGNYPNPFNPTTTIRFDLAKESNVVLTIYNVLGEAISTLVNRKMTSGRHKIEFDASNLSSGIYFYRINAESFIDVKKMIVIK